MGIRNKYYLFIVLLFVAVIIVWSAFYIFIMGTMRENTQAHLENTANQIMDELESEIVSIEQLVFTLSQNTQVKSFVMEPNIRAYFDKAAEIDEIMSSSISKNSLVDNVIVFNREGTFYRFRGSLGNTACRRICFLIGQNDIPEHLTVEDGKTKLIGYGSEIRSDLGARVGSIVVLVDEETVLTALMDYEESEALHVAVAAENQVIISDTPEWMSLSTEEISEQSFFYTDRHIGITPFSILVGADKSYLKSAEAFFSIAAAITFLLLGLALLLFVGLIRNQFFGPMLDVMDRVENLDLSAASGGISFVGNDEFDKLILKINEMLEKIEAKNRSIQQAELLIKNTEIKKQKAVIYSLKKQIDAHFTVNILNIIKILAGKNDMERTIALCDGLSALVRYAHDENEWINAWDEFMILKNYIDIMNIRHENKFRVEIDLDDRLMELQIPRMLLQPIIENAIVHGYRNRDRNCLIEILAQVKDGEAIVRIRDEGQGMESEALDQLREKLRAPEEDAETAGGIEHIALININRRIGYYYGSSSGLWVEPSEPTGLTVILTLGSNVM